MNSRPQVNQLSLSFQAIHSLKTSGQGHAALGSVAGIMRYVGIFKRQKTLAGNNF